MTLAGGGLALSDEAADALDAARTATRARLRGSIQRLSIDWKQFSPYFLAYKHGGLTVGRADMRVVAVDVDLIGDDTPTRDFAVGVWRKSSKTDGVAVDDGHTAAEIAEVAAASGRLAIELSSRFAVDASESCMARWVAGLESANGRPT